MSSPETPPGAPPPAAIPPPKKGLPKGALIGLVTVLVGGAVAGAFVLGRRSASPGSSDTTQGPSSSSGPRSAGATVEGMPEPAAPTQMTDIPMQGEPTVWVDVYAPAKVRQALVENPWLQEQIKRPLGQGFASSWAAFLGSTGEDLKASFQGAVFDVVAGQLLDAPFRAVWFSGDGVNDAGAPAFIVPEPGASAVAAYEALDQVARRAELIASSCPSGASDKVSVPGEGFHIMRWLVAEQALWAGRTEDRLVLARQPSLVLRGLCAQVEELEAPKGVDVEVGFSPERLGREFDLLMRVLGLEKGARLQFAAEGRRLVGRGIAGALTERRGLDSAPLSDDLLRLVPEDMPVLLALQLKLPESLETGRIHALWSGQGKAEPTRTRQVAVVWTPRGDASLPHELAILWGRPEDAPALERIFNGGNPLVRATLCKHHVLASSQEVVQRLQKACEGQSPNLLNAAGPVVQGLRAQGSVTLGVNTGRLLSLLVADGYWSEVQVNRNAPLPRAAPSEIEAARRDLETLPYVGLRGTVQGDSLVPGGFGS